MNRIPADEDIISNTFIGALPQRLTSVAVLNKFFPASSLL